MRRGDLLVEWLGDEVVLVDPRIGVAFALRPPASGVWGRCDGERSLDAIAAEMGLSVDVAVCVVDELSQRGLVSLGAEGVSRREALRRLGVVGGAALAAESIVSMELAGTAAASGVAFTPAIKAFSDSANTINSPFAICAGPNGDTKLWFTNYGGNSVGTIDSSTFTVTNIAGISTDNYKPYFTNPAAITVGSDENLYVGNAESSETGNNGAQIVPGSTPVCTTIKVILAPCTGLVTDGSQRLWMAAPGQAYAYYFPIGHNSDQGHTTDGTPSDQQQVTYGPDSAIWMTLSSSLLRITLTQDGYPYGQYLATQYMQSSGSTASGFQFVCPGPVSTDPESVWFTAQTTNQIGRVSTASGGDLGTITFFSPDSEAPLSSPTGIVATADTLWITNSTGGSNGTGSISTYQPSTGTWANYTDTSINSPQQCCVGPDGHVWFTNQGGNTIGQITTH